VWFDGGAELIQVQRDRFLLNWRRKNEETYPRYGHLRAAFLEHFTTFQDFLRSRGMGGTRPVQWEVTYVNHMRPGDAWSRYGQLGKVLTHLAHDPKGHFLGEPEDVAVQIRYRISREGSPIGRLHVTAEPASVTDGQPVIVLSLTARGGLRETPRGNLADYLDLGREWVVRGFTDATTEEMHREWKIER